MDIVTVFRTSAWKIVQAGLLPNAGDGCSHEMAAIIALPIKN